jgi:hypothetical protein
MAAGMQATLRTAARLALVLALLSGWSAGLLHPFKHVDEAGRLVHLAGTAGSSDGQPGSPAADKLCDVLAGLAACLPGSAASFATPGGTHGAVFHTVGELRPAGAPPFFAQGPPTLL